MLADQTLITCTITITTPLVYTSGGDCDVGVISACERRYIRAIHASRISVERRDRE